MEAGQLCEERHKALEGWLKRLENRQDTFEIELEAIKISHAGSSEQIRTIFNMISEIKAMLTQYTRDMTDRLRAIEGRGGKFFDGAVGTLITALIMGAVGFIIGGLKP